MDSVIKKVQELAQVADQATRSKMADELRMLSYSLESGDDASQRVNYRQLEITMIRVAIDLRLFEILASSESPMTLDQLQKETGAAYILLGRILRYLASMYLIKETGKDTFTSTSTTKALSTPGHAAGVKHQFGLVGPMYAELPGLLKRTNYQDMTDNSNTCWHAAYKTDEHVFSYMSKHPEDAANFNTYMAEYLRDKNTWLSVFPVTEEVGSWKAQGEDVLFVDLGGNVGHQCAALKSKYPEVGGRIVLQDLPHAIAMAQNTPGVEATVHDLFTPQPVKNAKFYYIANVLHDYPDDKCREILANVVPAMGENSVILIDERILPDTNVNWKVTQIDLTMMASFASIERTEAMWASLLDSVGLKIVRKYVYLPDVYTGVMVVERK